MLSFITVIGGDLIQRVVEFSTCNHVLWVRLCPWQHHGLWVLGGMWGHGDSGDHGDSRDTGTVGDVETRVSPQGRAVNWCESRAGPAAVSRFRQCCEPGAKPAHVPYEQQLQGEELKTIRMFRCGSCSTEFGFLTFRKTKMVYN